jgi:putative transposase
VVLDIPRDRNGTFDPLLIAKYQRRFPEFDRKIVSMYARGMTTREIQGHIEEIYGVEASPALISAITDAVMDEVTVWQNRPLEPCYPIVFMDAIRVNIRSDGVVANKAVFVALAVLPDGTRDVLGLWFQANEGAKFWAKVLGDLRNRGVQDILIAVVDGLKGFPQVADVAQLLGKLEQPHFAANDLLVLGHIGVLQKAGAGRCVTPTTPRPTPAMP